MQPRIVFVVMSAVHSERAIDQLARALAPHTVLIHHDFAQTPSFHVEARNAVFVPQPKRTGWACWGFSEGIFRGLQHAVETMDFDYLQLLSPSCLPIKPISAFEESIATSGSDANFDGIDLLDDADALMSVGYRAYTPERSLRHRLLRRLSRHYFDDRTSGWRPVAGVALRTGAATNARGRPTLISRIGLEVMRGVSDQRIGRHIFTDAFRVKFGSVWFGARRSVVEAILTGFESPSVQAWFSRLRIADEFLVPTLLSQASARPGPANHVISPFDAAHPRWLTDSDFDWLAGSSAFFARKFRDDADDPLRRRVLAELAAARPASLGICAAPA